jgi:predicted Zn-dependent protease
MSEPVDGLNLLQGNILRLLGEIGFTGVGVGCYAAANGIFDALAILRPQSELPWIGKALIYLSNNQLMEARKTLEREALSRQPKNALVNALLGLTLQRSEMHGAAFRLLSEVAKSGDEVPGVSLAKSLLETYKIDLWR